MGFSARTKKQRETRAELLNMLEQHGRCALVRPTGFGKTRILCEIACMDKYQRVLWVFPNESARASAIGDICKINKIGKNSDADEWIKKFKVKFMTYATLGRTWEYPELFTKLVEDNYDLVIFDEFHHMGANNVKISLEYVLSHIDCNKVHVIGGTATPGRMDGFSAIESFFGGNVTSPYNLNDMVNDNLIKPIYYVYAIDAFEGDEDSTETEVATKVNDQFSSIMNSKLPVEVKEQIGVDLRDDVGQLSNVINAPKIIHDAVNEVYYGANPNYLRFVIFFSTKEKLEKKCDVVEKWFNKAFPDMKTRVFKVYSNSEHEKNKTIISKIRKHDGNIDLIMAVNMVNEAYHVSNLTGVMMLRPTSSAIIYTQQAGRAISVNSEHRPLIIDFVDNFSAHALFNVVQTESFFEPKKRVKVEDQMAGLNTLEAKNITIVNKVAKVEDVVNRINHKLPKERDHDILELRIKNLMPISRIAEELGLQNLQVLRCLERFSTELSKYSAQICDRDYWKNGIIGKKKLRFDK